MAEKYSTLVVTPKVYEGKEFCEEFHIRTQAEAETALGKVDTLYPQSRRYYGAYGDDPELDEYYNDENAKLEAQYFKKAAQDAVDKFNRGEFPLKEWEEPEKTETPQYPQPNPPLPAKARDDSPTGEGNTLGKIVGQSSPAKVPATDANPIPTAETPAEKDLWAELGEMYQQGKAIASKQWHKTQADAQKWLNDAGDKLSAAADQPVEGLKGAGKELWNTVPDLAEGVGKAVTGGYAKMTTVSGRVLKAAGLETLGDMHLKVSEWSAAAADKINLDAVKMTMSNKAQEGGGLVTASISMATGILGLAKGAAKQAVKQKIKGGQPEAGARISGKNQAADPPGKPENHTQDQAKNTTSDKQGNNPEKTRGAGDPVDIATGDFLQVWPVIAIPGLLPLTLTRTYRSTATPRGLFGSKWADDWSRQLALDDRKVRYTDAAGVVYDYPTPDNTVLARNKHLPHGLLTGELDGALSLTDSQTQLTYHFNQVIGNIRKLSAITDRRQNAIRFIYDKQAQLVEVTRNDGIRLVLDSQDGQLRTIDLIDGDRPQRWVTCGYDPQGYLAECDAFQHNHLWHEYNAQGWMTRWHDTDQTDLSVTYDARGRVLSTASPSGYWCDRFRYDDATRTTTYRDAEGGESQFIYNPDGQVIREIDPLGRVTRRQWKNSQKMWEADPAGNVTTFAYNPDGALTEVRLPTGDIFAYGYDEQGQLIESVLPTGERWKFHYDEQGNLTGLTHPLGHKEEYHYGTHGELRQRLLPDGREWHYAYDPQLRLTNITAPDGETTGLELDTLGRLRGVTDALHQQTRYRYSDDHAGLNGSLAEITLPDGTTQQLEYDSERRVVAVTDGEGRTTRYTYGAFDLLTQVTRPDGTTLRFGYDRLTRLQSVTAATGETYRYERDAAGQIIRETDFTGRTLAYQYDKLGRRTQVQYPDGQQLRWHYSPAGLLVRQESWQPEAGTWVLKATTTYEYNKRQQLVKATNADAVVEYEYDKGTGLPTCERINGREIRREWDNLTGRPLSESLDGHTLHFGYHPLSGALNHFQFNQHAPLTLRHDALGRETVRESAHGFILASRYTATSLLAHQSAGRDSAFFREALAENDPHFPPQATAVNRSWQYDRAHNVRVIDDSRWGQTRYRYNTNDQILHTLFDSSRPHEEQFSYDANGNLSQHLPIDAQGAMEQFTQRQQAGRVVQRGDTQYEYDDNGRLIEKIEQHDGFRPQIWRYRWDTQNQLTHLETPDGSRWQYCYDPFGRRIRKIKERDGKLTAANLQLWLAGKPDLPENPKALGGYDYLWSGDQLIEEVPYQLDGTRLEARRVRWLYEPGSLTPAARFERGKLHYAISDHQGTVRELLDEQGEMVWGQHLTTWGHAQNRGGVPSHHPDHHVQCNFRFMGQYEDEESGLCYNRFRYFSPETAQYISPDPIGLTGGTNPYGYVHNPANRIDPLGLSGTSKIAATGSNSFEAFKGRSEGMFATEADARKAYELIQKKDWTTLEKMMPPKSWPPNRGFVNVTPTTLQPGTKIDRYGGWYENGEFIDKGNFVAEAGAPFKVRALPANDINRPYTVYEVVKPIKADMGQAIPWFGQPGMGTQYELSSKLNELVRDGSIKVLK
ncbi:glycohydrolase toxin TNT-related protein [Xenorhabdus kozodoii]|uniref:RHS family protein n=1 Tax=Xenorhabdus kozodoii TaxID=351676 RepID=A0A2D0L137_9GAMM|nr:glycohydrolase toxin TNT-related protein [Xenorhabdus kozodoii]PHM69409.1 RHS family protein [Xenorhabdus kozodoii]